MFEKELQLADSFMVMRGLGGGQRDYLRDVAMHIMTGDEISIKTFPT